jgi:uncharacterized membrane protein YhiD involved in acid resistance
MWNILIVIIIAVIIWIFNPLVRFSPRQAAESQQKMKNEVNSVLDETTNQVEKARKIQVQEQNLLDN